MTAHVERFWDPGFSWSIDSKPVTAGHFPVTIQADGFSGREPVIKEKEVELYFAVEDDGRTLVVSMTSDADFEVPISCTITERAVFGKVRNRPTVTVEMMLDFKGADLVLDPDYVAQRTGCIQAIVGRALDLAEHMPSMTLHRGDPINEIGEIISAGLPAHVRPSEFAYVRAAERAARAAGAILDPDQQRQYAGSLISTIPALARRRRGP